MFKDRVKKAVHRGLIIGASVPWLFGMIGLWLALVLVKLADKLWPNADHGNCWSYTGPKWAKHGGYIMVRPADDVQVPGGLWSVPHAIWVKHLPDSVKLEHAQASINRYTGKWLHRKLYFKYDVSEVEAPHNADHEACRDRKQE